MQKITPFLWFDHQAEEAMRFYVSVFRQSRVVAVHHRRGNVVGSQGDVMSVSFELEGQPFMAFNGGPHFKFTPAISFFVQCQTQDELDTLWNRLLEGGGAPQQCGWLTDKFGISWQIVPEMMRSLLDDDDPDKARRVMEAMMGMVKLDIAALQKAHAGS
jgi:predicted 3-demethylubiquinone-9 3-methyltransferase (glyoxalase superfamily)